MHLVHSVDRNFPSWWSELTESNHIEAEPCNELSLLKHELQVLTPFSDPPKSIRSAALQKQRASLRSFYRPYILKLILKTIHPLKPFCRPYCWLNASQTHTYEHWSSSTRATEIPNPCIHNGLLRHVQSLSVCSIKVWKLCSAFNQTKRQHHLEWEPNNYKQRQKLIYTPTRGTREVNWWRKILKEKSPQETKNMDRKME